MSPTEKQAEVTRIEELISLARARRLPLAGIRDLCDQLDELLDTECEPEEKTDDC